MTFYGQFRKILWKILRSFPENLKKFYEIF